MGESRGPGEQCCYAEDRTLVTEGLGAGTSDKVFNFFQFLENLGKARHWIFGAEIALGGKALNLAMDREKYEGKKYWDPGFRFLDLSCSCLTCNTKS